MYLRQLLTAYLPARKYVHTEYTMMRLFYQLTSVHDGNYAMVTFLIFMCCDMELLNDFLEIQIYTIHICKYKVFYGYPENTCFTYTLLNFKTRTICF